MNSLVIPSRRSVHAALLTTLVLTASPLHADEAPPVRAPSMVTESLDRLDFEISPMAPTRPLLQYRFQHPLTERTPGNAAPLYLQAMLMVEGTAAFDELVETLRDLQDQAFMTRYRAVFGERAGGAVELMLVGSRRTRCDWSLPINEQGPDTLLPELSPARSMAVRIQQTARYHIASGDYARAVELMRAGMTFARHIAEQGPLISGLVAVGIDGLLLSNVADMIGRADAPNLYWALRALPQWQQTIPHLWEVDMSLSTGPLDRLDDIRQAKLTLDSRSARAMLAQLERAFAPPTSMPSATDAASFREGLESLRVPAIEHFTRTRAIREDQAEKLERDVVTATYLAESMVADMDELRAIATLPYPELDRRLAVILDRPNTSPFSMSRAVAPGLKASLTKFVKADQHIAALTTVEALRAFAATHGGQLPTSLDQLIDTPAPLNPATGMPFEYRIEDGVAILEDATSPWKLRYTIRLAP